ncbi:MAG: hypothetical protein KKA81_15170 [Bacteroidetes bacterium]|nr:hypothetical protein [Bacteroidota bacterium]
MERLVKTAALVRNDYIKHLLKAYDSLKMEMLLDNIASDDDSKTLFVLCDEEDMFPYNRSPGPMINKSVLPEQKKYYRHDLLTYNRKRGVETHLCWPILEDKNKGMLVEDIPGFSPFNFQLGSTEIVVNPFPWFHCEMVFYPNAESVKGIIDVWFNKWFNRISESKPLLGVIHSILGPFNDSDDGESYIIDFGTASVGAFIQILKCCSKNSVHKIVLK